MFIQWVLFYILSYIHMDQDINLNVGPCSGILKTSKNIFRIAYIGFLRLNIDYVSH